MQGRLSLRERVVMLTLAAVVPLSALSVWLAVRETRSATGLVQSQLKFAASLVAANQDRALESAEHLLTAISAMPELRSTDRSRCQAYFESLRGRYPAYSNLGVIELDGTVACNANGVPATVNLADRPYFRDVLARRRFVVGEEVESRASGRRSIPFAMPVVEAGQVTGVAFAALDLEAATASLARTELPEGASVLVADRRGRVLMEHPSREALPAPGVLLNGVLLEAARSMSSGVGEAPDAQGRPRLLGYAASQPEGTEGLLAIVSIDRELVDGVGLSGLREQLGVAALMLLLGVAGAWWVGGRVILRPYKQILGAVRRLEQGRADVRIPLQARNPRGEFARIASAFNRMAESLQLRRIDLEAELGRSQSDYAVLEQVLNSMQEGLIAVAGDGQFLMFNEAAARLFPLHEAPVARREWPQQWGLYHLDGQTLYRADDLPLTRAARGESGQQQPLFVRNPLVPDGRLLHCSFRPMRGEGGASGGLVVFTDVTQLQRLQAEQVSQFAELRETQRRLMEAQRIGRVGNWDLDVASGHMWWSDEVYELFGLAREHFGATLDAFSSCVHPADRAKVAEARNAALENGGPLNLEYRIIRPDGSLAWMHDIAETRRGADGMAVWFGGVVQDISDSKNAEDELVQFTSMLKRTAEAAQAITADQTIEGTMQAVVDKARAVIGAHQAVLSLTTDNDWSQVVTALSVDERFSAYRGMTIMPDGSGIYAVVCESNRPLRLTQAELEAHPRWRNFGSHKKEHPPLRGLLAVPLVDPVGHNIGLIMLSDKEGGEFNERDEYVAVEMAQLASIAIDNARLFKEIRELNAGLEARIDERTAELARQEQQYRTLAEQAPEVVWNADTSGEHLTFLNHAWYELVGGTPQDWIGRSGTSAIHPDDRKEVSANWRRSRETLATFAGVRRLRARDGSYHTMQYKASPVLDEEGKVAFWVGIDSDITEYKAIEQALRSSNQELEAFSYSVSHDLRAPLGAIGGFSRALSNKLGPGVDERSAHYLARIQAGVEKMEQLIDALLSLAKVVRAQLTYVEVDLGAMAREVLDSLREQDPERTVRIVVQDGLMAQGDMRLLRVVMENLLGNAWKFTSRRADALIEVGQLEGRGIFFVRDNGAGFDTTYADKLFGAFQRLHTEAEFPGTGIGLATVRRIIARHQGNVWAESQLEQGTTFFFTLSQTAPPAWLAAGAATTT